MAKPRSFCKMIFLDDLTVKIMIPGEFVKNQPRMNMNMNMIPQICLIGIDEAGRYSSWDVKVEQIYHNEVRHNDFLLFRLVRESTFEVAAYRTNGCLKEPLSPNSHAIYSYSSPCTSQRSRPSGIKGFSRTIDKHNRSHLHVPTGIARETEIVLQDLQGNEWRVEIDSNRKELYNRICLSRGWNDFRKANGLVFGIQCWFEFDPSTGNVVVTKGPAPADEETSSPDKAFTQQSSTTAMKQETTPSFFKALFNDDYDHALQLPLAFSNKYGKMLSENPKLVTGSGETWNVKLEVAAERYWFTRGWVRFVKDSKLAFGEYLVFSCNLGKSEFHVSVYGICACERKFQTKNLPMKDEDDNESTGGRHPHFILSLKTNHASRLAIGKGFAEAAGLMTENMVVLRYPPSERCWPVLLDRPFSMDPPSKKHYFRLELSEGWSEFRRQNRLAFGNTYLFEYIADKNVIEVKLIQGEKN